MATKSIAQLHSYGDNLLKLLDCHHYCLRRNLYSTHTHLFRAMYQANEHFRYVESKDDRVCDLDIIEYSAAHHINN